MAEVVRDRYELRDKLGAGGQATTWRALDRTTGREVALKRMSLADIDDWKALELFEREGKILAQLDHPAIPDYVEAFHEDGPDDEPGRRFYLAQELVAGVSLKQAIADGLRVSEEQAVAYLTQLLEILVYLHELNPPVVHRDLKPSNIMRRPDGALALIDFGAIQSVMPLSGGGSTIVGTSGYMPTEQLLGQAGPGSDLYALGATVVHLLSGHHPADLPVTRMRIDYEDVIDVSPGLRWFLRQLLAPAVEDRFASARDALRMLTERDAHAAPSTSVTTPARSGRAFLWTLGALAVAELIAGFAHRNMQARYDFPGWEPHGYMPLFTGYEFAKTFFGIMIGAPFLLLLVAALWPPRRGRWTAGLFTPIVGIAAWAGSVLGAPRHGSDQIAIGAFIAASALLQYYVGSVFHSLVRRLRS